MEIESLVKKWNSHNGCQDFLLERERVRCHLTFSSFRYLTTFSSVLWSLSPSSLMNRINFKQFNTLFTLSHPISAFCFGNKSKRWKSELERGELHKKKRFIVRGKKHNCYKIKQDRKWKNILGKVWQGGVIS